MAARLGVSSMTIHRAIAGKPDISAATRDRILAEIERLGWRPNIAARGLRQGKTFTLGILVSNVAASFLPEILQGIDRAAEEKGYHTFVSVHEHEPARAEHHLRTMQSKGVDGLVHYPTEAGTEGELVNELALATPTVLIMRELPGFHGTSLLVDDVLGGRMAAEHLLSLGHRRFGFLGYRDNLFTQERWEGFSSKLKNAGVSLEPDCVVMDLDNGAMGAREAAIRMLRKPDAPTALFCASDRVAARALQGAWALGLRVPTDLSVVGYNGDAWAQLLPAPLTTITQPRLALGEQAAQLVLAECGQHGSHSGNGNGNGHAHENGAGVQPGRRVVLNPWLVIRESSGPVPGRL